MLPYDVAGPDEGCPPGFAACYRHKDLGAALANDDALRAYAIEAWTRCGEALPVRPPAKPPVKPQPKPPVPAPTQPGA